MKRTTNLFWILFISVCCQTKDNGKQTHDKKKWILSNDENYRIEKLFYDSTLIQENFYKDNRLDSFILHDYINKTAFEAENINYNFFKYCFGWYQPKNYLHNDSIHITIWQPVERELNYKYKIFMNDSLFWVSEFEDEPIFNVEFPINKTDTIGSLFVLKRSVFKDSKILGYSIDTLWWLHNNKLTSGRKKDSNG